MQMRRPAAVDIVIADKADQLPRDDGLPGADRGQGGAGQVAVQGPELWPIRPRLMFQNNRRAIVIGGGVIDHAEHSSGQRRIKPCARTDENINAQMLRPRLGRGGGAELRAFVNIPVLAIKTNGKLGVVLGKLLFQPVPMPCRIAGKLHPRRPGGERQHQPPGTVQVDVEHLRGLAVGAGQPAGDRGVILYRRQPRRVPGKSREKRRVGLVQPGQQRQRRGLRDGQIGIIRVILGPVRRDADRCGQPGGNQIEQHLGLKRFKRENPCIGADQRGRAGIDIGAIQQRIGQRHRQFIDLPPPGHIAKVDDAADLSVSHQQVVIIGILMDHRAAQLQQMRGDAGVIAVKHARHQRALGVADIGQPRAQRRRLIQIPQKPGPMRRRVPKPTQRP